MRNRSTSWLCISALVVASTACSPRDAARAQPAPSEPRRSLDEGYAGSEACVECHAENHESWHASFHRTMTQVASRTAVLAPFEGQTPALEGVAWKLEHDGDDFFVQPTAIGGAPLGDRARVAITTGSHHYQVYWFTRPGEPELQQLPLVWHRGERQWIPRKSLFLSPPSPTSGSETGRWSQTCMKCHATHATRHHEVDGLTHVEELGIACEACHGPAAQHVALRRERQRNGVENGTAVDATIVNPADLPHDRSSQVCGQCHAIQPLMTPEARADWEHHGFAFRPGEDLARTRELVRGRYEQNSAVARAYIDRNPETLVDSFWSDGQVRVSGREYNGLVESPCYQRGPLSCLSCHAMHPPRSEARDLEAWADDQLKPGMDGPRACLQCHPDYGSEERVRAHTHHAPGSTGADCLDCHMPYTTYGLVKAIRSHTITSPNIAATIATGRPDACNQCHLDRTLGWAADRLHDWYGQTRPVLEPDQESTAASIVWALSGDAGQRALMAWSLGWMPARAVSGTGWMPFVLSTLLQDPYDAVRFIAQRTLRLDPRHAKFALDFTQDIEDQRKVVRAGPLSDWLRTGLSAAPERGEALLLRPDGSLDQARFQRIFARIDKRNVHLAE